MGSCWRLSSATGATRSILGADEEMPIQRDLVGLICELVGFDGEIRWDTTKPDGQPRRRVDPSRARDVRLRGPVPFREGLRRTIDWYRATGSRPRSATAGGPRRRRPPARGSVAGGSGLLGVGRHDPGGRRPVGRLPGPSSSCSTPPGRAVAGGGGVVVVVVSAGGS